MERANGAPTTKVKDGRFRLNTFLAYCAELFTPLGRTRPIRSTSKDVEGHQISVIRIPATHVVNVSQSAFTTTVDKAKLCLEKHDRAVNAKYRLGIPLTLFLTTASALTTATFHDTGPIPAGSWQDLYAITLLLSLVWLVREAILARKTHKDREPDQVIRCLTGDVTAFSGLYAPPGERAHLQRPWK